MAFSLGCVVCFWIFGVSFVLRACMGVVSFVSDVVWFRTCALAPAPVCRFAAHTEVRPGFDSTSPAKSNVCFVRHRTGNLAGQPKKSGTVGAFGKAGNVDTICISL